MNTLLALWKDSLGDIYGERHAFWTVAKAIEARPVSSTTDGLASVLHSLLLQYSSRQTLLAGLFVQSSLVERSSRFSLTAWLLETSLGEPSMLTSPGASRTSSCPGREPPHTASLVDSRARA